MDKTALISFIEKHLHTTRQVVEHIVSYFEEKEFDKHSFFLKEGKVSNEYLFLSEGFMRAFTFDTEGNEVTTWFYSANNVVFEVSSFFMRIPSTENIQAVTHCKGFGITYEKLNTLFHSVPQFRDFGRMMLVKGFAAFKQRTLALINKSAEERYASLVASDSEIFQHAQLKHIASYLGITETSLSRIRRDFSKKE